MKRSIAIGIFVGATLCAFVVLLGHGDMASAQKPVHRWIKAQPAEEFFVKILKEPDPNSETLKTVFQGHQLEVVGQQGDYLEVNLPDLNTRGFILEAETIPTEAPVPSWRLPILPIAALALIAIVAVFVLLHMRSRRSREEEARAAMVAQSIKDAEELFRSGEYADAIEEFKKYIQLQSGEIRSPDVYRRLAVCYQKILDTHEAAKCWEKMRNLGGLKSNDDYVLGVDIMTALGKERQAAEIYEQLLEVEIDEDKRYDIRKNLFGIYRRLKEPEKLMKVAMDLLSVGTAEPQIVADAADFLFAENRTDLAAASGHQELIQRLGEDFLEEGATSADAERIYLKCLELDHTDKRFRRILARKYRQDGDYRKAVNQLLLLNHLDKENSDEYLDQAAKLYVENAMVQDALNEGNPQVIKKIAKIFLSRSEVTDDAVAVYERLLELQPKMVGVNKILSTVYLTRGDLEKYMEKLRLLHEIDGKNHDYLTDLAKCVIDNDMVEETIREGNRDLTTKLFRQLIRQEAHDNKTVRIFETLIRHEPSNVIIRDALARAYELRGEYSKALEAVLALCALKPKDEALARRAGAIAIDHNLLDVIKKKGSRAVLTATAALINERKLRDTIPRQIVAQSRGEEIPESRSKQPQQARPEAQAPPRKPPVAAKPAQPIPDKPKPAPAPPAEPARPPQAEKKRQPEQTRAKSTQSGEPQIVLQEAQVPKAIIPESEVETFVSSHLRDDRKATVGSDQVVEVTQPEDESRSNPSVSTFVSSHLRETQRMKYKMDDLFRPESGGLAFRKVDLLYKDTWGEWFIAVEMKTGHNCLLRVFDKSIMSGQTLEMQAMDELIRKLRHLEWNLVHPNILDLEESVSGPGKTPGLTYSFFPQTLDHVLKEPGKPDMPTMLSLLKQIVAALGHAGRFVAEDGEVDRIYHTHLNPSLIMVDERLTTCKVAGLGHTQIYREVTGSRRARREEPGLNPAYMAPELFRSKGARSVDEGAVDAYALGLIAYFMVTGEFPFEGPSYDDFKFDHAQIVPPPPKAVNPGVPNWLDSLIMACLEKNPVRRCNNLEEIEQAFKTEKW